MRGRSFFLLISLLLLNGCVHETPSEKELMDENQVFFFSNESDYKNEVSYYDALIELKKEYPEVFKNMVVISPGKEHEVKERFDIDEYPALIIVHGNEIIVEVIGNVSKEDIIKPVSTALEEKTSSEQNY
ncbi:small peptidoglycan-associated lipoprotein [Aeribacillus pallidus]|jgi:hypothetical protein|uniref:small peptidoglycan-associated lipoprotein n=1 Tax=Aeribacillus pallidus TaxID=33936 RepID=UPI001D8F78F8|nr:small peptidoglycan-associated lipoprotein [Bacillus sp. (in: firmicutes)]